MLRKYWAGAAVVVVLIGACATSSETRNAPAAAPASAAPTPAAPAPEAAPKSAVAFDDSNFATIEEAEAALERARADLDRLALLERGAPGAVAEAPAAAAAPPPPARATSGAGASDTAHADKKEGRARAAKPKGSLEAEAPAEQAAPQKSESPCETGCKAFASLMRAKAAVCRLDTPGGTRCTRAEDIARDAEVRVRSCACQQ